MCKGCVAANQARLTAQPPTAASPAVPVSYAAPPPAGYAVPPAPPSTAPSVPAAPGTIPSYTASAPVATAPAASGEVTQAERCEPVHYFKALLYGLGAAIIGAFIWDKIVSWTGWQVGYLALAIAFGVGLAVKLGAENREGPLLPFIGALLSGFSMLLGYILLVFDKSGEEPGVAGIPWVVRLVLSAIATVQGLGFDWFFVALGAWIGWGMAKQKIETPQVKDQILQNLPERMEFAQAYPDQYPALDRATFQQWTEKLQSLGFQWVSDFRAANQIPSWPLGMARLFMHPEQRVYAEIGQVFPEGQAPVGPWVSIMSHMDGEWQLSTSNTRQSDPGVYLLRRPRSLWSRHPGMEVEELFRTHLAKRAEMMRDLSVQPRPVSSEAYFEQQQADAIGRRAVISAKTNQQLVQEHKEAQKAPLTEWWGEYAGAGAAKAT